MARDYLNQYRGNCLTCKNYDIYSKGDVTVRGYRCVYHHRPMAMDEKCSNYSFDITRSNITIDDAVDYIKRRGYEPRPDSETCYITTITCKILGLPDDCEYLREFRKLRDEYMVNTEEGLRLLYAYDIYGPQISAGLEKIFHECPAYARSIVDTIVIPCYFDNIMQYIQTGDYAQAMQLYVMMSVRVGNIVGVNFEVPEVDVKTLDRKTIGHGRIRKNEGE